MDCFSAWRWALALAGAVLALPAAASAEIYTCTDAGGRRHTADRPIAECSGRPQVQLNPSGTIKRVVSPGPTIGEEVAFNVQASAADTRQQAQAQQQLDRALLRRYPSQQDFERQRALALGSAAPELRAGMEARFDDDLVRLKGLWRR